MRCRDAQDIPCNLFRTENRHSRCYDGIDSETGEAAAIKVLAPGLATEEGFRARFEAEIESLKKLRHPNIVRLYGYGEEAGTLFYAMERVDGTSLEEELRRGRRFELYSFVVQTSTPQLSWLIFRSS